ncbi:MAG: hypothetical protein U0Y82_11640 [Thermoleophilia bacterium]
MFYARAGRTIAYTVLAAPQVSWPGNAVRSTVGASRSAPSSAAGAPW